MDSDKALYVGARPNGGFNVHNFSYPTAFWNGAVDEVRVSRGARYAKEFKPTAELAADSSTIIMLSNDEHFGPFVTTENPKIQAMIKGPAKLMLGGK